MKLNRKGVIGIAAAAAVAIGGGTAFAATSSPAASPRPPVIGYNASVGKIPIKVSALGTGATAVVNAADTLSLTVGSPSGSTYAQAALSLPAGSVLPASAPTFTTDHFSAGSPRFVFTLASGDELMNNQASSTVTDAADATAADWEVNLGSGWVSTLDTYSAAVTAVGGPGQALKSAYIVADGDQAAGTTDTISAFRYDGEAMKVSPLYAPVPRLSHGQAQYWEPTREQVSYTVSDASAGDWEMFTIVGQNFHGQHGWVKDADGVNTAYYEGLAAKHGYTVYYTDVAAQGSTVPLPGSVARYVYEAGTKLPVQGYVFFTSDVPTASVAGEYCPAASQGMTEVVSGVTYTCENDNGLRWVAAA